MKKGYTARITRKNPSAFIFMVDTSGSMENKVSFNGEIMTKAEAVASIINGTLAEIVARCRREEGYRDYFDIAVMGYGGDHIHSLLPGDSSRDMFHKPFELAAMRTKKNKIFKHRTLPDGREVTTVTETKEWVKPSAIGKTPMYAAMSRAYDLARDWTVKHFGLDCFPPVVINITDGEATDASDEEMAKIAGKIRSLSTFDGNVLLFNIYISSSDAHSSVLFPSSCSELPDTAHARLLFEMSSLVPRVYGNAISAITGKTETENCRGISYNASMTDIVNMLNIGTISVNLLG